MKNLIVWLEMIFCSIGILVVIGYAIGAAVKWVAGL